MGLCTSQNQQVSSANKILFLSKYTVGAQTSLQLEQETLMNNYNIDNNEIKNFVIDFNQDIINIIDIEPSIILEQITQKYPNLFHIQLVKNDQVGVVVTAKDYNNKQYVRIRRRYFKNFESLSNITSILIQMQKLNISGFQTFEEIKIYANIENEGHNNKFYVDTFFNTPAEELDVIQTTKWDYSQYIYILNVLVTVAKILKELHNEGFSYKCLRPSAIHVMNGELKKQNICLRSPSFSWTSEEKQFLNFFLESEAHYMLYDAFCLSFLALILLDPDTQWEKIHEVRNQNDINVILKNISPKIPQTLSDTLHHILRIDHSKIISVQQQERIFHNLILKGPATSFKHDSLGAFLSFHGSKQLNQQIDDLYIVRKNQIHIMNYKTKNFNVIKLFRKKKKFILKSPVTYSNFDEQFYFFANSNSHKAVRIQYMYELGKQILYLKQEVDFFKSLRGVVVEDPRVYCINPFENQNDIVIFNNKRMVNEKTNEIYYKSYIINISNEAQSGQLSKQNSNNSDELNDGNNKKIQIFEGPNKYQQHKQVFYFYDPHNKYFYSLPDCSNIFENGIKYSFMDSQAPKGDFKDGVLRFACGSPDIFEEFCKLTFKITQVEWATEVQHGVFLTFACKNIFILDFNFKCFYSLASLSQIQSYEQNTQQLPYLYQNAYETRNQNFEVKYPFISSQGKNVLFQEGLLHMLGRKEIETVLCSYKVIPEQASLILVSCQSMNSGKDILNSIKKEITQLIDIQTSKTIKDDKRQTLFRLGNYNAIRIINEKPKDNFKIYKVFNDENQQFILREIKIKSLDEYYYIMKQFQKKINNNYIINCKECFLTQDKENKQIYVNLVEEHGVSTLEDEIKIRKKNQQHFEPKELAYILKIVFNAVITLLNNKIEHGNIIPLQIYFLTNGQTKLAGFQAHNSADWVNDLQDACSVIHCCVMNEIFEKRDQFNSSVLAQFQSNYDKYPGLYNFLQSMMQQSVDINKINLIDFKTEVTAINRTLQRQSIDTSFTSTMHDHLFWIAYGNNYIVSIKYDSQNFCKTKVKHPDGSLFKFSKYNMFTYDSYDTMYIVGAIKEDLVEQSFYKLEFKFIHNEDVKLKKLENIPCNILSPTLSYYQDKVFSFGGYELNKNGSKIVSNKVFMYIVKKRVWKQLNNLPLSLVGSTAVQCQKDKNIIYLFGGVSEELDLTGKQLNFFVYNVEKQTCQFKVDFGNKIPFSNSRFTKPIVNSLENGMFVSFQKIYGAEQGYFFEFFELERGGVHLKYYHREQENKLIQENVEQLNIFTDVNPLIEYRKLLQDEISMVVKKDTVYILDEEKKDLVMLNFSSSKEEAVVDKIPCAIVGDDIGVSKDDGNVEEDNQSQNSNSFHLKN